MLFCHKPTHMSLIVQAKMVFFEDAGTMLLQKTCNTMIDECGYTDPFALPSPVNILRGQTKIFQVRFTKYNETRAIDFVADAVFEDAIITYQATHTPSATPTTPITPPNKTPVPTTNPPSATPTTPKTICDKQLISTPITPPSAFTTTPLLTNPITETSKARLSHETSAKKQLFQTSSETNDQPLKKQKNCEHPPAVKIKANVSIQALTNHSPEDTIRQGNANTFWDAAILTTILLGSHHAIYKTFGIAVLLPRKLFEK